jgi:hypothetical protein
MRAFIGKLLPFCAVLLVCGLVGCGGSGGSTSGGGGGSDENPAPSVTSLSPTTATAGSAAITLTLRGTDFISTSSVQWNGNAISTSYQNPILLYATVPATDVQSAGSATVTVVNPSPGGGTATAGTFTISPAPPFTVVSVPANDLVWDRVHQVIYLALPSDGTNANSIQVLNPYTAALGQASYVGVGPDMLSVSANAKYLYAGLSGSPSVQRMTLPSLALDINIPLGAEEYSNIPFYAEDLQASPVQDGTVAVIRAIPASTPEEDGGVVLYDDGVARQTSICGFGLTGPNCSYAYEVWDSIQWKQDGTEMFAANLSDTGFDFYTAPVTANGFGTVTDYPYTFNTFGTKIHYDATTGYVYDEDGIVVNPQNGTIVGTFAANGLMVPDGTIGRAFFLVQVNEASYSNYTLESFDINTLEPISSLVITGVIGTPSRLIRWGSNGLAFTASTYDYSTKTTTGAVYLVSGSFVTGSKSGDVPNPKENVKRPW